MLKRIGLFMGFSLLAASALLAQTSGTIVGHVGDPTGAVIPGVTITLTNTGTNTTRTTVSTSAGDYTFPDVPPGVYDVEATHPGFKVAAARNVQLQVQQSLTQNFALEVGEVTQTVSVSATAALLQTQNSSLGTVVPTQTLDQMPVNNRNYLNLTAVSANANVVSSTQGQAGSRQGGARASQSISVGGSRIMFNHYTLDGINNSDPDFNSYVVQPSIDAIQEMKVQNGVYPAQYGYNATQVNVVTKSGTNNYHGAGFYFLRNNYADALGYNYFYPTPQPAALPYKYNDYGFVLTGPISIPHIFNGKNRFFFMVNDEWYSRISFSNTANTQPTQAVLGGDFSQYRATANGAVVPIYDPATGNPDGTGRTQFPGNVIPASRIDPISLKYIQLFDAPAQNSLFQNNYTFLTSSRDTHDGFNVRGDYYLSSKQQFAFRFSNGLETNPTAGFKTAGGTVGSNIITSYYQYMGSHTWTPSPTVVNVATFGWTNFYNSLGLYSQGVNNAVGQLGIPGLQPGIPATWGIPNVAFTGDIYSGLGDSSDGPYVTKDPNISINDNITWVRGKHSISVGFAYERQTFNELGNQESRGAFAFQANATAEASSAGKLVTGTGSAFADFMLGQLYTSTYAVQIAQADYKRNVEAAYVDDNYKFTPKLTVSAGLRYELTPPWYNTLGQEFIVDLQSNNSPISPFVSGPEPQNLWPIYRRQGNCSDAYQGVNVRWVDPSGNPVNPAPQCANGKFPNSLMQTQYDNWAPRLGIAYTPNSTWVIRTGFGMYYDHDTANARFDVARNLAGRVTLTSGGGAAGEATINWGNAVGSGAIANIPPPYSFTNAYRHKTTYSEVWLFDVQKQLGQNWQLQAGYLGSKSDHLYGFRNANYSVPVGLLGAAGYNANGSPKSIAQRTPYPNYGVIQLVHDLGNANYNAFTFQVNKRFSNGFNLISSYTYAKSLDDTSGIRTQSSELFPQNDMCLSCEYGPSDFDVKHRVVGGLIYTLPIGPGMLYAPSSKIVYAAIGGWQLNVLGTLQTGIPFNMGYNDNNANTNTISGGTPATRANYVSGQPYFQAKKAAGSSGQWVNIAAFPEPAAGFLGSTSRNMLYGPGYQQFDVSLGKTFNMPYNENHKLQFRFDSFNALNHTNFGNPQKYVNSSTAGKITGSNAPSGSANGGGRELELGARYTF
ncbi:MAG TPA: TonB-dependent receptor [Acidobacteriaceae bacterium]|nr:TonB-dependent receptor [Acidobacteriaceae bacterium]